MKSLKVLALSALLGTFAAAPAQAQWWGPGWGGGPWGGPGSSFSDFGPFDGNGWGDFSMSMNGGGRGYGNGRYYGYNAPYGYGYPYGGYTPYGGGYGAPYGYGAYGAPYGAAPYGYGAVPPGVAPQVAPAPTQTPSK